VLEAIQQKVDGQEITAEPTEAPQTKIIDLMDALKQSLAKRGGSSAEKAPGRTVATKAAKELPASRPRKRASGAR
jgi:non-homologous end joining protein Ku